MNGAGEFCRWLRSAAKRDRALLPVAVLAGVWLVVLAGLVAGLLR